jgi:O6-methylguanine-DNA--protein-cysteine methyltransferase
MVKRKGWKRRSEEDMKGMRGNEPSNIFRTSLGWIGVAVSEQGIYRVVLPKKNEKSVQRELKSTGAGVRRPELSDPSASRILTKAEKLLRKYFSGERVSFDLPLDLRYHTAFQQAVWRAAAEIPHGETRSYAWIAKRIRNPRAVRAVGQALGANPIPIIIP